MTARQRATAFGTLLGMTTLLAAMFAPTACALPDRNAPPPASGTKETLANKEQQLAEKYRHLEDVLLRMAELHASSDPRRAALLRKAVAQSKEQLIGVRLERLVELLGKDQLSKAIENQSEIDHDLRSLLELLMSENRAKHIENEKARLREYLKQLSSLIKQQKDIQARTAGGDDAQRLTQEQAKLSEKTGRLSEQYRNNEQPKTPAENENPQSTAQQRLDAAQQRMKDAEAQLREAKRSGAGEKQEAAIEQLQLAKAKLEEILRQLREEEIARKLTSLETRFRKMLQMQEEVYEGTVRLDKIPQAERTHHHEIEAGRLGVKETQIVSEAEKALILLQEDGSAAAFLEAAQQIHDEMQQIAERLAQAKVGPMTQSAEEDVIAAFKEMISSLKQAQKDREKKKSPPKQQGAPGEPQEPPLVDALAELRMIRALQMRVNVQTARYSKMIDGEQAQNAELVEALRRLAERQQRIYRVTHDLQSGKNQ